MSSASRWADHDAAGPSGSRDQPDHRESRNPRDPRDPCDPCDPRDPREPREPRDPRELANLPALAIRTALLDHFDASRRAMPWRETSDPYAIWVSEVMLQQTRVDTVVPYWERWMARFPTVAELAAAELDVVLKHWEGLGYYSRARNLHSAARVVRERHGGAVPGDPAALRQLPGIGEYTAGAVASIAFHVPTPAVDGNVRRVLSRLCNLESPTPRELRERAAALVPDERPGDFNQALMELGATVCTPRSPDCDGCPLAEWCQARREGVQELRPLPKVRGPLPEERVRTLVLVREDGALLLVRRPLDGLLGGLWEFPSASDLPEAALLPGPEAGAGWQEWARSLESGGIELEPVVHVFSHKRVTYEPVIVEIAAVGEGGAEEDAVEEDAVEEDAVEEDAVEEDATAGEAWAWLRPERAVDYALPVAQRKILHSALAALRDRR